MGIHIKRLLLELNQYGYTPRHIKHRLFAESSPKVLANSIPKSGTNLLLRSLYLFPQMHRKFIKTLNDSDKNINFILNNLRPGEFCAAHLKFNNQLLQILKKNHIKRILIVRDPRDIIISNMLYITYKDTGHRLHSYFKDKLKNDDERIMATIRGIPGTKLHDGHESLGLVEHYSKFMDWQNDNECLIIKFEDLIGPKGGGDKQAQFDCLKKIVKHINLKVENKEIKKVSQYIFEPSSRTFIKGQIGSWKGILSDKHIELIKKDFGNYLIELGYEKDLNW